mmetsp:Transcript_99765/g.215236  ORF Transcript_99765/g.215236 Transcript_99765/m.215236 type:complete len:94 (+) Transcript_99765:820-1101(+)
MFTKLEYMKRSQSGDAFRTSTALGLNWADAHNHKNLKIRFYPLGNMEVSINFVLLPQLLSVNFFSGYNFDLANDEQRQQPHHRLGAGIKFGLF